MIENIHFRSTFDVAPRDPSTRGLPDLLLHIAEWIRLKEGRGTWFEPAKFVRGIDWHKTENRAWVRTDSLFTQPSSPLPYVWALRYEHGDAQFAPRRWRIDVGVSEVSTKRWRLALTVGNYLKATFIGKEPGRLPATAPRFVRTLIESEDWICTSGSTILTTRPIPLLVGKANVLSSEIANPNRGCPIIYASCNRVTGNVLIDAPELARAALSAAVLYVAESAEIDEELDWLLPRAYRAVGGAVRVYAPGTDLSQEHLAYRHRLFDRARIEEIGAREVGEQIVASLTRRIGWVSVRSSVGSIDDVDVRRREMRRQELQKHGDETSRTELLRLFEDENARLSEENRSLQQEKQAADELLDESTAKINDIEGQFRRAAFEADAFRAEAADAKRRAAAIEKTVSVLRTFRELPSNLAEVVDLIESLYGQHIVFTPRARQTAADARLNEVADASQIAWRVLQATATVLPKLAFDEVVGAGTLPERFRSETDGLELALTEGSQTNKGGRFATVRSLEFDGKHWDISPHVKFGNKPPKCLRVHFALDQSAGRIIVGHCGDHLPTAGSQRRH